MAAAIYVKNIFRTMNSHPHLLVCISGHGYGHVAQTAPVLNALAALIPGLKLTIRTSIPLQHLRSRIRPEFHYLAEIVDPGMEMVSALEVNPEASMKTYAEFHANWEGRVRSETGLLQKIAPDAVLSNVAYLPLAGAARLGIPAIAMCSLNWADIFRYFCGDMPGATEIQQQIEQAYLQAESFMRLTPAMPMPWLPNQRLIGPIAQPGINRRSEINSKLGLKKNAKLILVSMGGIAMRFPMEAWPKVPDVFWVVPGDWQSNREDAVTIESLNLGFSDLLASCDAMLTKPGYGAFVEAAASAVPVLYVEREAWPEQQDLVEWLSGVGVCMKLEARQLQTGEFGDELRYLLGQPKPGAVMASGNEEAANYLSSLLSA